MSFTCTACLRNSPCSPCSVWSNKVWNLAEERRLYATRRSVMTQRRNQKKNKKSIQSDLSDSGSHDGSTAPHSYTARAGPIKVATGGGSSICPGTKSTSHHSASHRSTSHWSASHWAASHRSSVNQSPVNQSPVIQSPVIQSPVNQSPVN